MPEVNCGLRSAFGLIVFVPDIETDCIHPESLLAAPSQSVRGALDLLIAVVLPEEQLRLQIRT
jgi:hypothetical protein